MPSVISRRQALLRAAVGGITFLAVGPDGRVAFGADEVGEVGRAAGAKAPPRPVFKVLPYLQPGPGGPLRDGDESVVLAWQTNRLPSDFSVTWKAKGGGANSGGGPVVPVRTERYIAGKTNQENKDSYDYAATLPGLRLGTVYDYRVTMEGRTLAEGFFTTRKGRGRKVRFVAFGDNSWGDVSDRMIAYQTYRERPEFVLNTGDIVYDSGLCSEYARLFFPVHNADTAAPRVGAPVMRSLPYFTVLANHDLNERDPKTGQVADFDADPDACGYFTCLHLPLNGPEVPSHPLPVRGKEAQVKVFRDCAGPRYPRMANYSFDWGDGHFLCLDSNVYVDPTDPALQAWIRADLAAAKDAAWKFVAYHHPAFCAGDSHFKSQHMRVLSPLFEEGGVDVVLHGHSHTYQRTRPLRFRPADVSRAKAIGTTDRVVPGAFTVDTAFDGEKSTRARGIMYVTTGAGGKYLYDPEADQAQSGAAARWRHPEDGGADYVAAFVSDRHSLTVFDMDRTSLVLRQVDQWGEEIDRCRLTKG